MAKKTANTPKKIVNRKARHDYDVASELVAGLVLNGRETKSLRMGHGHLRGAYVTVKDGELWLLNATITGFNGVKLDETEQTRSRKLLLKHREIEQLLTAKQQGQSIVPLELLTGSRYIKVRIAIGRGRKHYDKREVIKKRDQDRANQTELKSYR
jgi:SsrA-binding protein